MSPVCSLHTGMHTFSEAIMLIATWQIDARFGHKQQVIDKMKEWEEKIGKPAGMKTGRLLTGSIGALEATVMHEWEVENLTEIEKVWSKLATHPDHQQWGRELEPYVVSGTSHWQVYRVL